MSTALRILHGPFGRVALLDMDRRLVRHAHPHCHVLLNGDDTHFLVGQQVAPLTDMTAVLVNVWQTHAYVHDPARRDALILALYIEPQWLRGFRPNWEASGGPGFFERPGGEVTPEIRRLAHEIADEMVDANLGESARETLVSALMIAVIERFTPWRSVGASLREGAQAHSVDRRIRRVIPSTNTTPKQTKERGFDSTNR